MKTTTTIIELDGASIMECKKHLARAKSVSVFVGFASGSSNYFPTTKKAALAWLDNKDGDVNDDCVRFDEDLLSFEIG